MQTLSALPGIPYLRLDKTLLLMPFVWDSLALSVFASVVAPFGGFFASGFKRAFKIKDFGDLIPGELFRPAEVAVSACSAAKRPEHVSGLRSGSVRQGPLLAPDHGAGPPAG